jgi:hypothetical protein
MKDPRVEQWLNREGVEWYIEKDIPLSMIDWEASLKNQARLGQVLIQEHVDELSIAIIDGLELPDPIGYYNSEGRIVIISGNHRVAAYKQINELKLGGPIEKIDWYIVNTFQWKIDMLTRTANVIEGLPLSKDERLEQAKHLVRLLNYTELAAAKALAISKTAVGSALQADEVAERLARYRFTERIPPTTLCKLYRIKQDNALVEVARLAKEAQLSADEVNEMAKKVEAAAASEKQQHHILEELRRNYKDRIARTRRGELKRQMTPTIKFRRAVNAINAIRPESVIPLEPDLRRRANWAVKKLGEVTKNGQSA